MLTYLSCAKFKLDIKELARHFVQGNKTKNIKDEINYVFYAKIIAIPVLAITAFLAHSAQQNLNKETPNSLKDLPSYVNNFEIEIPNPGGGGGGVGRTEIGLVPDYIERQNVEERLKPFGENLLGDSLDIKTGVVSFSNTDISIPGNFSIPVSFTRTRGSTYVTGTSDHAIDYARLPLRI
ncbi:hypothetical protein ISG33_15230 [Glaciecola sp. MH2013]|uniref:hypothetical protein n=1 Tax=Glaciecola sp. MH2013 TaxID=2785524 RepID=UPI0018A0D04F|nr:hypothetical protein [Glaciecola sp. MH2013]MBF7074759.1 hypothetical protein [Glaciecola sp. MH2013]